MKAGGGIDFYAPNGQENQKWLPIIAVLGSHAAYFANEQDNQLLDVRGDPGAASTTTSAHDLDQWPLDGGINQRWSVTVQGNH
ncbi:hypothetical protein SAMN05216570_1400 [Dyella sp. OK004]|uniref:RICIN domain-containing protein n=1 Tax=Dyella sp. OK004 TaxID=1855292 RepID=UPI0008F38E78|nr:RICIN domain-containing protein [Dyella sp. OK004]SFS00140.1 hypothetical protein SAMN05216570_1400 [Dyella sp. OK004]